MHHVPSLRLQARPLTTLLLLLACAFEACAADTYNLSNRQLSIPSVAVGSVTFTNMVVTVASIVSGPNGTSGNGSGDTYSPASNELTVPSVIVAGTTYYNVVVTVAGLVSIGGVSGADTYSGGNLDVSLAQLGGTVYDNVVVTVGTIVSFAGGMPALGPDSYDSLTNRLTVPAVQVGSMVYTNVVVTVGKLLSVGGIRSTTQEANLHSFSGNGGLTNSQDGAQIEAGLIQGSDGNLYGTAYQGGQYNMGAVIRITTGGTESVFYSFSGTSGVVGVTDGTNPAAGLIEDSHGNFYGTTQYGGAYGEGTVFKITSAGVETVLHSFGPFGSSDGAYPSAALVLGKDGNYYGTTKSGGANGVGTVFRISTAGAESVIYSFSGDQGISGSTDAAEPYSPLLLGSDGNFYGTTAYGGTYDQGSVFRITTAGAESVIYSFSGNGGSHDSTDGALPYAGLIQASDGNFYGVTEFGGLHSEGTVFRISAAGAYAELYSFSGGPIGIHGSTDAAQPVSALIQGSDGNFYGTSFRGGSVDSGTVFKISTAGVESVLYSFTGSIEGTGGTSGSTDGGGPEGMILGSNGTFYGTTEYGGAYDEGAVFSLATVDPPQ